ncbi:MAG TPA: bifunctional UDP-N-acetylglucosamine diphosphorylase/glucosamine-1-phosphate N-acetyltransferase GlmU [Actinomycetota bacterium]|nr:bifunctional UDP-N-acetylglucosamine diphosphorylase/glucosamine-1-phosphate N-acetyltransferase GlmU [Actinomycetota bacterium]
MASTEGGVIHADAIVLAAGDGKRLKSQLPKVLHEAAGRPLLGHVLAALAPLPLRRRVVVVSPRRDEIADALGAAGFGDGLELVVQEEPRGTADAVRVALEGAAIESGTLLVTPGDTPLLETETLDALLAAHAASGAAASVLTADMPDPAGYGRVIRGEGDAVERIVEHRDATAEELLVPEINAGVYAFDAAALRRVIGAVGNDNAQGEQYLGDVLALLAAEGGRVVAFKTGYREVPGVNSRLQLAEAAAELRRRACERWMSEGVTIVDPATTYLDADVVLGADATIHPFTFLEGTTSVGRGAEVGPQTRVVDSVIEDGATVTFSVVRGSSIGPGASVGPFASLRPGTRLERGARAGTFVETKNTTIGEGSKANHLAYLGDAEIGRDANVGAGTITCNWDGRRKHKTVIEDEAYIASDTMLVAPVRIGKRAATGAGAVVRDDVPDEALAVGVPARIIEGKGNKLEPKDQQPPG